MTADIVHIGAADKEEANRCLREQFPGCPEIYEICDPWESSCQPSPNNNDPRCRQTQTELCPGTRIIGYTGRFFLFSGAVESYERGLGLTVAHATKEKDKIVLESDNIVGECRQLYDTLELKDGAKLTADLAFLDLSCQCSVHNTVRWPIPCGKTLQIQIYKGQRVPDDTKVMILDRNGDFQYGSIRRDHMTDKGLQYRDLHNVLAISTKKDQTEVSITQLGDSGALVMSLPSNHSNVVDVYGIVNHIYTEYNSPTDLTIRRTLTVASSLWDVIHELHTNPKYRQDFSNNNIEDDIDFLGCLAEISPNKVAHIY